MKGYSSYSEKSATARAEGLNASYKDLAEICGRLRGMKADKAVSFLEKASIKPTEGGVPVLFKRHCKKLGHRRELGGRKGRYPWKSAAMVLKVLQSALANGRTSGMGDAYTIANACANKKMTFPRLASKGRWARSNLETSRVEIVLIGSEVPKGVSVVPPAKKAEAKVAGANKSEAKKPAAAEAGKEEKKTPTPVAVKPEEKPPATSLNDEAQHEHKHEAEKAFEHEKRREDAEPHHHGEYKKR
jgi:ribosomal protein L22